MITEYIRPTKNHISAAVLQAGEDLQCFAHCQDTVEVGLLLSGTATVLLSGKEYTLSPGTVYTANPDAIRCLTAFSEDARLLRLIFSPDMICPHPEHFFYRDFWEPLSRGTMQLPPHLPADHPALPVIRELLMTILNTTDRLQCFTFLMELCLTLMPHCIYTPESTPDLGVANRTVQLCMVYIINQYHKKIRLARIARYVKCHPNYLCSLFKSHTGMTVVEYLYHIRVETAAELLCKDDLSISKISEVTGFPNRSTFYKKFRQIMGVSPSTYRKEHTIHKSPFSGTPGG